MQRIFIYNINTGNLELDLPEILLIKEFADIWDVKRNKCADDKTGNKRILANKELKYIWLFCDWKSPYREYLEQEKHTEALRDSGLTQKEWENPIFRAAVKKYLSIKDSSRILSLLKTANRTLEKLRIYLDNIDFDERGANDAPIYKAKDVLADIAGIGKMNDYLQDLEKAYKDDQSSVGVKNRGGEIAGFGDE